MEQDLHLTGAQLAEATRRGLLSPAHKDALRALAAQQDAPAPHNGGSDLPQADGDESFRLVGGGNDVFVALGTVLLMSGLWAALTIWAPDLTIACAIMAVLLWGLAEFVTRRGRMKLSSLLISLAFTGAVSAGIMSWVQHNIIFVDVTNPVQLLDLRDQVRTVFLAAIGAVAAAALVWFARFRVPVMTAVLALAALALAAVGIADSVVNGIVSWQTPLTNADDAVALGKSLLWVPLFMGLAVFAIGVYLDLKDRHRDTLLSDCAFWMHVVSAPLIVHPLFVLATGTMPFFGNIMPVETGGGDASATVTLLALVALFFYVALAIDRRSLLVPALGYFATVGIVSLVNTTAQTTGIPAFAVVLVLIGLLVILFGAGWQHIRAFVVGTTLPAPILRHLPPMRTATLAD